MDRTYYGMIENNKVVILDERSKIGYSYPRVLVMFNEPKLVTCRSGKIVWDGMIHDVCLGQTLMLSEEDFNSWLDGSEINVDDISTICKELSISFKGLVDFINSIC